MSSNSPLPNHPPSDGNFTLPFATSSSLADSLPGSSQSSAVSYNIDAHRHQRQMRWTSSFTESSWSNSSAGNAFIPSSQYHHLLAQFNESQRENASLLTRNTALESRIETLMLAYNMLLARIPAASSARNPIIALRREDYPNVQEVVEVGEEGEVFPELDEEEESKEPSPGPACGHGKHRAAQGINVTMKYIECEDGTVVDGFRAAEIRRYARSLWVQMALEVKLPATWSDADATSLITYNESMAQRFAELRLCAADWKANLVAIDNYPSWRHNWLKRKKKEKRPVTDTPVEDVPTIKKSKLLPNGSNELLAQLPSSIPGKGPEGGSFNTAPLPTINVIPGTPLRVLQPEPVHIPFQEGQCMVLPQSVSPYNLNFTIKNPLALTSDVSLNSSLDHQSASPALHLPSAPSDTLTPANLPATPALPFPPTANDDPKRLKGTRMRPTKATTARNLCALEWVKHNPQGTTHEFKIYYTNLSEDEKQAWEDKSRAASRDQ